MDELQELEVIELLNNKNILLTRLEAGEPEDEILNELNNIQEQLDLIY